MANTISNEVKKYFARLTATSAICTVYGNTFTSGSSLFINVEPATATRCLTIIGYGLVTAVVLVTIGRFSDIFGRVKLYKIGFLIFTIGSIACALSQNILQLIIFRLFQGLGGAFLFANSAAIITDSFEPNERGKALGINQISFLTGQFVGLILGGVIAPFGWSYIFWVTVPFGIIGTIWAQINLKELGVINKNQKSTFLLS
jgi:multidrug resistance protein